MATLAQQFYDHYTTREAPRPVPADPREEFRLRPFPNEDVHLFVKRIDNSRVVRDYDPGSRRKCWSMIASAFAVSAFLTGLFLPSVQGLLAGYSIESLRQEKLQLEKERTALEFAETKLLTVEHLQKLAERQKFVETAMPQRFIYLDGSQDAMAKVNESSDKTDTKQ